MDLIQKAKSLGYVVKNEEYYLWEIQKWLRDVHNYHIMVDIDRFDMNWYVDVKHPAKGLVYENDDTTYKTYEEALEEGLEETLKLLR